MATFRPWSPRGIAGFPDGTFRPDAPVTRGQLIKLAAALSGLKREGTPSYTDIAPADWYYGWAPSAAAGRLIGWNAAYPIWTGDILAAETPVTRAEAATVLANMLEH